MKIVDIREKTVALNAPMRNANIAFDTMTASAVAVRFDTGVTGLAFDSIGRYGHGGLLRERFIPRLLAASPDDYCDPATGLIDPVRAMAVLMANEKAGGHGERSGAVGMIDCALWDARAKAEDKPLYAVLAEAHGNGAPSPVPVYGSGGHYTAGGADGLAEELRRFLALGFERFKIKIGGAPLTEDLTRIEAALAVAGAGERLAVDANGVWGRAAAKTYLDALAPFGLAWVEEPAPPLAFHDLAACAETYSPALGTGENIFSADETELLLRHGGLRPDRDWLQMDVSYCYGVTGYLDVLAAMNRHGWSRTRAAPHAGHLLALHTAVGLGLGGHEAAPDGGLVFGGFADDARFEDGKIMPGDAPGTGIEAKPNLYAVFADLIG
jgi:L-alanine-DL-glutamate epimerase-like enolase superfamily enzyme